MTKRIAAAAFAVGASLTVLAAAPAAAQELPPIVASAGNSAPACVTPGRLMAFVRDRNPTLPDQFADIATEYMRIGQELGVRWDIAFFQMLVETGWLTYKGDVKPHQNNFAGLGATGGGVSGESFSTVRDGVRAHLQHLQIYAGVTVARPISDRTAKVQEWRVLDSWRKTISGPVTFTHMTRKWSPGDRGYARDIATVAERFMGGPCLAADPAPEMIAGIRRDTATASATAASDKRTAPTKGSAAVERAVAAAKASGVTERSGLGVPVETETGVSGADATRGVSVINAAPAATTEAPATSDSASPPTTAETPTIGDSTVGRFASNLFAAISPPPVGKAGSEPKNCRVWTASYGGQKALIIKTIGGTHIDYTVLDVNEGREQREADAYIAAYAKGGKTIATFGDPSEALTKAFELCPEGNKKP